MFIPKIIESTTNSILYAMPNGKPNPKQNVQEKAKNPEIILQGMQKGPTCTYYVYNYLRERIGDNCSDELKDARKIEKICSQYRKEQTKLGNIFQVLNTLADIFESTYGSFSLSKVPSAIELYLKGKEADEAKSIWDTCLKENNNTSRGLKKLINEKETNKAFETSVNFYKALNVDYRKRLAMHMHREFNNHCDIDDIDKLNILTKRKATHIDSSLLMAEIYGLKESRWRPGKIEDLIQELIIHGPLVVGGQHGRSYYEDEPLPLSEQNGDYMTMGLKPGATRKTIDTSHSVLVVGAKIINGKGYVYIKEPNDENDPKKKETNKIYKISNERFCENLVDLFGNKKGSWSPNLGFAHYRNFKVT